MNKIYEERVRLKCKVAACATTYDRSAKGAATMLIHDENICGMLDCGKIGKSNIRDLIRTRNK